MNISFIELYKSEHGIHYGTYQNKDTFLISLNMIFNDFIGDISKRDLVLWLNDISQTELLSMRTKVIKLLDGNLGLGSDTAYDDFELFIIDRQQFLDIMAQWREIKKRAPERIILARNEHRIWLCDDKEFKKKYKTAIDTDMTFDIDYLFEGYILPNDMHAGIFRLDQRMIDNHPERFSIIKNHNNKYGIVKINTKLGPVERTMFLWEWSYQDLLEELVPLLKKYYQLFDPHRIYRQSELVLKNKDGYIISMILDHDTNKVIAAYPIRSNFY